MSAQPPRGMRDFLPDDMRRRRYVMDAIRNTMELYGFEPLDTPALEDESTLFGKYGPDAERLIYRAGLKDPPDLALRYDLSVPLARVAATESTLPPLFKRYQIAPVWRGERPQRGRYREFYQADADIVGSDSMLADAEIIALVVDVLRRLGFRRTVTLINNRKVLTGIGRYAGVPEELLPGLYRSIDKLDKIGRDGVRLELRSVGLPGDLMNRLRQGIQRWQGGKADLDQLRGELLPVARDQVPGDAADAAIDTYLEQLRAGADRAMDATISSLRSGYAETELIADEVTNRLLELLAPEDRAGDRVAELEAVLDDPTARQGLEELRSVTAALAQLGLPADRYAFDPAMVRGLEYYTGTIFETVVTDPPIGSITGGGRFDNLISLFGRDAPAVGTSFGVDRLIDVMIEHELFPDDLPRSSAQVLVTRFDAALTSLSLELATSLRAAGIATEVYLEDDSLGDQIRYSLKKEIPVVLIAGPEEAEADFVTVRDLDRKSQDTVPRSRLVETVARMLQTNLVE